MVIVDGIGRWPGSCDYRVSVRHAAANVIHLARKPGKLLAYPRAVIDRISPVHIIEIDVTSVSRLLKMPDQPKHCHVSAGALSWWRGDPVNDESPVALDGKTQP